MRGEKRISQNRYPFLLSAQIAAHVSISYCPQVFVSAETDDPPLLSLLGGSTRTVLRASSLTITAQAEVVKCVSNKTNGLSYDWSELSTGDVFTSTSAVSCVSESSQLNV